MDVDFVHSCFEEQNKDFEAACDEMIERRDQLESAQLKTAEELETLREKYEQNLIEQAKESRVNRWLTVASLLVASVSMVAAVLALIL